MMSFGFFISQLLVENIEALAPDKEDPLHELLDDLGEVPTVEDILGMLHTFSNNGKGRIYRINDAFRPLCLSVVRYITFCDDYFKKKSQ